MAMGGGWQASCCTAWREEGKGGLQGLGLKAQSTAYF